MVNLSVPLMLPWFLQISHCPVRPTMYSAPYLSEQQAYHAGGNCSLHFVVHNAF
jgi:hypothetical protein